MRMTGGLPRYSRSRDEWKSRSCPWFMPQDEARSMTQLIEAEIRTGDILVRLRSVLEEQIGIEPPVVVAIELPVAAAA